MLRCTIMREFSNPPQLTQRPQTLSDPAPLSFHGKSWTSATDIRPISGCSTNPRPILAGGLSLSMLHKICVCKGCHDPPPHIPAMVFVQTDPTWSGVRGKREDLAPSSGQTTKPGQASCSSMPEHSGCRPAFANPDVSFSKNQSDLLYLLAVIIIIIHNL